MKKTSTIAYWVIIPPIFYFVSQRNVEMAIVGGGFALIATILDSIEQILTQIKESMEKK